MAVEWAPQRMAGSWSLQLTYLVSGNLQPLKLPSPKASGRTDGLWAHTCFEAFFSEPGSSAYREFNFSPSTEWAHYRFIGERERDLVGPEPIAPLMRAPVSSPDQLVLNASVAVKPWQKNSPETWFAPTAVLELNDGSLSYWAVSHPAPQPDFHTRAGWAIPLSWAIL